MQVGRSAILLQTTESKVLLDCGFAPGGSGNIEMIPRFDFIENLAEELDAVVITHAHLDHMGMVPYLFKYDYRGPVLLHRANAPADAHAALRLHKRGGEAGGLRTI